MEKNNLTTFVLIEEDGQTIFTPPMQLMGIFNDGGQLYETLFGVTDKSYQQMVLSKDRDTCTIDNASYKVLKIMTEA